MNNTKQTKEAAIVTFAIVFFISVLQLGGSGRISNKLQNMGLILFWLGVTTLIVGIILSISNKTTYYGRGMLIAGGVLLLIGFSVCSVSWGH